MFSNVLGKIMSLCGTALTAEELETGVADVVVSA